MLTGMSEEQWTLVFRAVRSRRGDKGRDDRRFLEALHYFSVHNITWRALPKEFGPWNTVWKRFWRLWSLWQRSDLPTWRRGLQRRSYAASNRQIGPVSYTTFLKGWWSGLHESPDDGQDAAILGILRSD